MTATQGYTISPRERLINDIKREIDIMTMVDLAALHDRAISLNSARVEHDYLLQQRYPLTPEATDHAE